MTFAVLLPEIFKYISSCNMNNHLKFILLCTSINYLFMQRYAHDFQHSAWIHILWFDIRNYIKQNIYYGSCNTCFFLVLMILGNKLNPCLYYCSIDVLKVIHTHLQSNVLTHTHTYAHTRIPNTHNNSNCML